MKAVLFISILALFLLSACEGIDVSKLSDEDLKRLSDSAVVCNKPYMRMGAQCCLDKDGNNICDSDERPEPAGSAATRPASEDDPGHDYYEEIDEEADETEEHGEQEYTDEELEEYEEETETEEEIEEDSGLDEETELDDEDAGEETAESECIGAEHLIGTACETYIHSRPECKARVWECVDGNAKCVSTSQGQEESCNGLDDDCDGIIDDGYPQSGASCDEGNGKIRCYKGNLICTYKSEAETCNGIDDDDDGQTDEGIQSGYCTYWHDGSGWGNPMRAGMSECIEGESFCRSEPTPESKCDGVDNNNDGRIDEGYDMDKDGYARCKGDCNDSVPYINAGAPEKCNEYDDDCDGHIDEGC